MNIRTFAKLGAIFTLIGGTTYIVNTFAVYKKSSIHEMEDKITISKDKIVKLDSSIYSLQQIVDIKQQNDKDYQLLVKNLSDENKSLKKDIANTKLLAEKVEANGNVRYFEKMIFQNCFRETFKKPDCIK